MPTVLAILIGGAAGSLLRYALGGVVQRGAENPFPLGTLVVNVLGCLVMGLCGAIFLGPWPIRDPIRAGVIVGLLGGFTTFSSLAWQTFELIQAGRLGLAALNVALSNGAGLIAIWAGFRIGKTFLPAG